MKRLATGLILALTLATTARAATVTAFSENFEGTLAAWTDRNPGNPEAAIFADPLRAGNHVLGFNRLGSAGSIYSTDFITTSGQFTVSFEYLGLTLQGSVPGDSGGFFGVSQAFPANHYWVAGSQDGFGQPINLVDDGTWHTYNLTFSSPIGQTVHLMFEDFVDSGGVTGDVFFDNVRFNDSVVAPAPFASVPEPSSLALFAVAGLLGTVGATRRRRTRANLG